MSFAYGIFHAAGPGHGKAAISSYLVANEETWRRDVVLSFASALIQALVAIIVVGVAAVLLGATAKMMGDTVRWIETASHLLIIALGARLLLVKAKGFLAALRETLTVEAGPERGLGRVQHFSRGVHCAAPRRRGSLSLSSRRDP